MNDNDHDAPLAAASAVPNPGSDAAREAGCICPTMDNNRGKWAPWPPDGWWITAGCPVHNKDGHVSAVG